MGNLSTKGYVLQAAKREGFIFKKRLGQNFLIDANIARRLAEEATSDSPKGCLEVGAGAGALTEELMKRAEKVLAVEIDPFCVKILESELGGAKGLEIVHGDFLKLSLEDLSSRLPSGWAAVSNLPYYIATPILSALAFSESAPRRITATMQREVAERISSPPQTKAYSAFTVLVGNLYSVERLFDISSSCFYPKPDVDSAAVQFLKREKAKVQGVDSAFFEKTVHACFAMRRKTLANNVSQAFSLSKAEAADILQEAGVQPGDRAERLIAEEFGSVAKALLKAL
jgi:16S rRNA (adenine1518-N6/adenine1519-N6)-dimethyltransferase